MQKAAHINNNDYVTSTIALLTRTSSYFLLSNNTMHYPVQYFGLLNRFQMLDNLTMSA